ncbi:MAG: hypothetical protein RLZZ15_2559 [Verrucomicrobiota bacterium]|jgi:hypothetical protein
MPQSESPAGLGLAVFMSRLVTDAAEAFVVAQQRQHAHHADLLAAAALPVADFANAIPEAEIDRELAHLFPSADPAQPHAIFVGAPYRSAQTTAPEDPPIQRRLGVTLVAEAPSPVGAAKSGIPPTTALAATALPARALSLEQVQSVRTATRMNLAVVQQTALRAVLAQPRTHVIVDSARLMAKVALSAEPDAAPPAPRSVPVAGASVVGAPWRLAVRMAEEKTAPAAGGAPDIFGEIEIRLKTVTG